MKTNEMTKEKYRNRIEQKPPILGTYTIFDSLKMLTLQEAKPHIQKKQMETNIVLI